MTRSHTLLLFVALSLSTFPLPALAADICTFEQTELECKNAVILATAERFELEPEEMESRAEIDDTALAGQVDAAAGNEAVEAFRRLVERNTGINSEGLPSSVLDLLSLLGIDVDTGGLGDDQESLALELNRFLGLPVDDGYQVRILLKKAQLYAALAEKIPEESRAERKEALEKGLDDFDNAAFVFTYSPTTPTLGRNPEIHSPYFADLFEAVKRRIEASSARFSELSNVQADLIGALTEDISDRLIPAAETAGNTVEKQGLERILISIEDQDYTFESIRTLNENLATRLLDATEARWSAWYVRGVMLDQVLEATRFFSFADLVDNQPQLYANVEATARDELVGPDEVKVKVTYEHGFVNANKLRGHTRSCRASSAEADVLSCFQLYLTPERLAQIKRGDRLAVSLEYSDVRDDELSLPDGSITVPIAADREIVGSLVYGRYLDFTEAGRGQSRVDFSLSHDYVDDDPDRNDRWLLTLTYSQRVAGDVILAAGVTWADKAEFRGDVDHEISARVGLTYKLFKDDTF